MRKEQHETRPQAPIKEMLEHIKKESREKRELLLVMVSGFAREIFSRYFSPFETDNAVEAFRGLIMEEDPILRESYQRELLHYLERIPQAEQSILRLVV